MPRRQRPCRQPRVLACAHQISHARAKPHIALTPGPFYTPPLLLETVRPVASHPLALGGFLASRPDHLPLPPNTES
ncbi:unnamed protein product [Schistocephalus solidus]|uniref:Uncharacterized protein n=1 Tax=Schistocephalus solidus TaxID=70667 RepID=A0A183SIX1_SCHSO|nr:unnamed protein product [Schistocephalus solidus]